MELKACPCCGGNAECATDENALKTYFVRCTNCGMRTPKEGSAERVIDIWNFRSSDNKTKEQAGLLAIRCLEMIVDALENLSVEDINMWNIGRGKGKKEALEAVEEFRQWITDEQMLACGCSFVPSGNIFDLIDELVKKIKEGGNLEC